MSKTRRIIIAVAVFLFVLIVVIGIAALVLIPRLRVSTEQAKSVEPQLFLKRVYLFEMAYFQSYGSYTDNLAKLGLRQPQIKYWSFSGIQASSTGFVATLEERLDANRDGDTHDEWKVAHDSPRPLFIDN